MEALGVTEHLIGDGDDAFDLPAVTDLATDRGRLPPSAAKLRSA
jgi:hypothetical protein